MRRDQFVPSDRIAIYAALPPPYGGVGVHVERLTEIARKEGIPYQVYDQLGKTIPERHVVPIGATAWAGIKFLLTVREPVIHFHNNGMAVVISALFISSLRRKKALLTIHSEKLMRRYDYIPAILRWLLRHSLRRAHHVFCVSNRIARWLIDIGVRKDAITVASAFLPPTALHTNPDHLSPEIKEFLRSLSPIVGTHGWFGYFVKGMHVYSFDMVVSLAKALKESFPQSGLYTVVSGTYDEEHRESILRARRELGLEKNWLIIEEPFHAVALYAKSDLFVRPTVTDGDSISIRECLHLGVPVIASDAVDRPDECILFRSRDTDAMIESIAHALRNIEDYRTRLRANAVVNSSERIMEIYRESLRSCSSRSDRSLKQNGQ